MCNNYEACFLDYCDCYVGPSLLLKQLKADHRAAEDTDLTLFELCEKPELEVPESEVKLENEDTWIACPQANVLSCC
jgi:hypothetical protein